LALKIIPVKNNPNRETKILAKKFGKSKKLSNQKNTARLTEPLTAIKKAIKKTSATYSKKCLKRNICRVGRAVAKPTKLTQ
jgi:hypothetical protein